MATFSVVPLVDAIAGARRLSSQPSLSSNAAVKSERGVRLDLPPHPDSCDLDRLRGYARRLRGPLAIDLFCGAGGLSLGLAQSGYNVILGVDRYEVALETHAANFGGASALADLSDSDDVDRIVTAIGRLKIDLVAGGPPCQPFSRAGEQKIRSLVEAGVRPEKDDRVDLWRGFFEVVERVSPRAILIENVPDMAFGGNTPVFKAILSRAEELGYQVHCRILRAWHFGVPQHRGRLFIVGLPVGARYDWPEPRGTLVTVRDAIGDLPRVAGGDLRNIRRYCGPVTSFQRQCRADIRGADHHKIYDHITRPVRADDVEAFRHLRPGQRYDSIPEDLRRYRSDTFDDKYNRLDWDGLSRTITAHIAKDGYWYIHPTQNRTLTVREAARLQTFPDTFRFAGFRTNAFRQVGEAVPPNLALELGTSIRRTLRGLKNAEPPPETRALSQRLGEWLNRQPEGSLFAPWRSTGSLWLVLLGGILSTAKGRYPREKWQYLSRLWPEPKQLLEYSEENGAAQQVGADRIGMLRTLAGRIREDPEGSTITDSKIEGLPDSKVWFARSLCGLSTDPYPSAAALRVSGRIFGERTDSDGTGVNPRLLLIRATTGDECGKAYAALNEIGEQFCKFDAPRCAECPLSGLCLTGRRAVTSAA